MRRARAGRGYRVAARALRVFAALSVLRAGAAVAACENGSFHSTLDVIQAAIFERHGCTNALCHGAAPGAGGLDLRASEALDNLVDVPAQTPPIPGWTRVL